MPPNTGEAEAFRQEMREFKDEVLQRLTKLETLVSERYNQQRASISARSIWTGIGLSSLLGIVGIILRIKGIGI